MIASSWLACCYSVAALAWAFTIHQAILMDEMEAAMWRDMNMSMNGMAPSWSAIDVVMLFVMWSAMMAAMMIPGASPMITAFAIINQRRQARAAPYVPTAAFLLGYLIVWAGFSVIATALQWLLQTLGFLTTMMQSSSYYWSAALFGAAGLYQLSPLKETCLAHCRSPDVFVLTEWRDGALGAVVMGLRHGLFCMGCCAALMLLLFAVAVMDLRWVVALTVSGDKREASARSKNLAADNCCWADGHCLRVSACRLAIRVIENPTCG